MDFSVVARTGLTQQEFGALAGVSRVTANSWLRGKMQPHRYIKARIAQLLQLLEHAVERGELPLPEDAPKKERVNLAKEAVKSALQRKAAAS